jgi:IS605 OrfB family transposase
MKRLTFKFDIGLSNKQLEIIKELSWHCTKLYNTINYEVKNNEDVKPYHTNLDVEYRDNWHSEFLHSHNRQKIIQQLSSDWKSFYRAIKDYKKNSSRYLGRPKPPNYKNMDSNPSQVIFTNYAFNLEGNKIMMSLSKKIKEKYQVDNLKFELPETVQSLISFGSDLQQIRFHYDRLKDRWVLLIVYKKPVKENNNKNIMSIDLGLNNLATITFKDNSDSYIINGRPLKSKNSYFNKEISRLQSIRMKQVGSKRFKDTKNIRKLRLKRKNYIMDYIHKASREIVNLCNFHDVAIIVVGKLKNIKQNMNYNKSFYQIPIQLFTELIEYKAELEGISVEKINESYSSGCSALDLENINKKYYDKSRRVERGLFKSNDGININADVNGSLNILRKYLKYQCIPELVSKARDNGYVNNPLRLRVS